MKRTFSLLICFVLMFSLAGCFQNQSDMPFNGDITFHQIKMTIPSEFIRDSVQSSEDVWMFEQGWYKKTIVIMRSQIQDDPTAYINAYASGLQNKQIQSETGEFIGYPAAKSSATREDGVFWQELSFVVNSDFYAIALNGGTEADFLALIDTVSIDI